MAVAVFIDTSVLLNLLDVPQRNSDRQEVREKFLEWQRQKATFVLPVTSIVEGGNAVAQVSGGSRWSCITRFVAVLDQTVDGAAPWAASGTAWDTSFLRTLIAGGAHLPSLPELMKAGLGVGDAGILGEIEQYRQRVPSATPIVLWTLDETLGAYGPGSLSAP